MKNENIFKYKEIDVLQKDFEKICNKLGKEGWEIVKMNDYQKTERQENSIMIGDCYFKIYFKKLICK